MRSRKLLSLIGALSLSTLALSAGAAPELGPSRVRVQHLSGPSADDALTIYKRYLTRHRARLGVNDGDVAGLTVRERYRSRRSGMTHLYLHQELNGLPVAGTEVSAALDAQGRLLHAGDKVSWNVAGRQVSIRPGISAADAVRRAALHLDLSVPDALVPTNTANDARRRATFVDPSVSRDPIPAQLAYVLTDDGAVSLAWNLVIRPPDGRHWWDLHIASDDGTLLRAKDWVARDTYTVFPAPLESPNEGARVAVTDVADPLASPFGWHDTNGVAGPEFTDTRGNNVMAQEDADGDDVGGLRPSGRPGLNFDAPVKLSTHPSGSQDAAVTNLFYWANYLHDVFYHYGFDEAAGNFQQNNYGRGGIANDPLKADAQDGADTNNAQMGTPPDGADPHMEMFLFERGPGPGLTVNAPANIAGTYSADRAFFGGQTTGLSGSVVLALDAADFFGPTTTDACSALTNAGAIAGNIALVDRGECLFTEKLATVQAAGATGIIIANNAGDGLVSMSGEGSELSIVPVFIGQTDGATLKSELANGLNVTLTTDRHRDSALDNEVIIHEYAHGVTTRLTGGPGNSGCLNADQSGGMGEGWSDWFSLALTAMPGDKATDRQTVGTFSLRQSSSTGRGFRTQPYSRDMGLNSLTFADIASANQPHGVGEVWAVTLWDMYWSFVHAYGFDADLMSGTGGNNRAIELVINSLKLQPCDPTFVQARDAILQADLNDSNGDNQCLIWESFARRGIGASADAGSANATTVAEAFDIPVSCQLQCGDGTVQAGEQCDDGNVDGFDGCAASCKLETLLPPFSGIADGGQINVTLSDVPIQVSTVAGQSGDDIATALSNAINANTALSALGIGATVKQRSVAITSPAVDLDVADPGVIATDANVEPHNATLALTPGLNLLGMPVGVREFADLGALLRDIAQDTGATSATVLEPASVATCELDDTNEASGLGCSTNVLAGNAWLLQTPTTSPLEYDVLVVCPNYQFHPGNQLAAFPCASPNLTARRLAQHFADEENFSVHTFVSDSGRWRGLSSQIPGDTGDETDFAIALNRGYLISSTGPISLTAPTVRAGFDRGVTIDTVVNFLAELGPNTDSDSVTLQWTLLTQPAQSVAVLQRPQTAQPALRPDVPGTYRVALRADNGILRSAPALVTIHAFATSTATNAD